MRPRNRAIALGAAAWVTVMLLGAPVGSQVARPPLDRSYSLLGSSWTFGVFSTGVLQEPDFRMPYTQGNSAVVVRPIVRGDAAWFDPGFIVRDAQANPSEKPCPAGDTPEAKKCADDNKKTQDSALATFRHPFLARCVYPDAPNTNFADPLRIFERRDFKDGNFPTPPATTSAFGAIVYGDAKCQEDYGVTLWAVTDQVLMGAEASPTLHAASMRSSTKLSYADPGKAVGVVETMSEAQGLNLMNGLLTIDKLIVSAEARSSGELKDAKLTSAMKIVGAKVANTPVEIRRDGVFVSTTPFPTETQRKAAQDAVNTALARAEIKVVALGVTEEIRNNGEDVVVEGGGIRIDWVLPRATLPDPILNVLRSLQITPPQTTIDTTSVQIGHVNVIAHAVKTPPLPDVVEAGPPAAAPVVLGEQFESVFVPTIESTYQVPALAEAISQPQPTSLRTTTRSASRGLVKLPSWAIFLLAMGAGTVVSSTYLLTQHRLPIPIDIS